MITLFRRIRQNLIESGSLSKYLLYATGEILLVVLGILIAIQVSNWNEDRILEESAAYHLSLLSQDLDEDKELLTELIGIFENNDESILRLLNVFKKLEPVRPVTLEDIIKLQLEYNFRPRDSGLSVLVNTGEIGALGVGSQNLISKYYRSVDAIEERDKITNAYIQTKLEPHIFDEYNYIYGIGNSFPLLVEIYIDDTRPSVTINEQQLLSDKKMEALLVAKLYQNQRLLELYNMALENLTELQSHIQD